jgi:23S rRNA pseudouridine1911/1915/1917 synthase
MTDSNDGAPPAPQSRPGAPSLPIRAKTVSFEATGEDQGLRLDQVLARRIEGLSRRQARTLLDLGGVFVNNVRTKVAGRLTQQGDQFTAYLGGALTRATNQVGTAAREQDASKLPPYEVLFEDADIVVVNKPAGLLTAPTPESDRNNLSDLLSRRLPQRQSIFVVHRIDLQTSGILVFAKTTFANRLLSERFAYHDIYREYVSVVLGSFPDDVKVIELPVRGKRAVTNVEVIERFGQSATMLRLRLETGRTHQIRLHVKSLGCPVLGDPDVLFAKRSDISVPKPPRMALHAAQLRFAHPGTRAQMAFEAPLPKDLSHWIDKLRAACEPK